MQQCPNACIQDNNLKRHILVEISASMYSLAADVFIQHRQTSRTCKTGPVGMTQTDQIAI